MRGLPDLSRSPGNSMPWSSEFRTKCTSGSLMSSTMVLSISVSWPWISNSTSFWREWAISRTKRGKRENTASIGTMRVRNPAACSSSVMKLSRAAEWLSAESAPRPSHRPALISLASWTRRFRYSTSSPIRLTSSSSLRTSTRMVCFVSARGPVVLCWRDKVGFCDCGFRLCARFVLRLMRKRRGCGSRNSCSSDGSLRHRACRRLL